MPQAGRAPSAHDPYREHRGAYRETNLGVGEQIKRLRESERIRQRMKRRETQQVARAAAMALPESIHDEF